MKHKVKSLATFLEEMFFALAKQFPGKKIALNQCFYQHLKEVAVGEKISKEEEIQIGESGDRHRSYYLDACLRFCLQSGVIEGDIERGEITLTEKPKRKAKKEKEETAKLFAQKMGWQLPAAR